MARVVLTADESRRIEEVLSEMRPLIAEFFTDARRGLSQRDWELLWSYTEACISSALQVGSCLHAIAEAHSSPSVGYPGRGRDTFVSDSLRAWRDSFAPIKDPWRLAIVAERMPGGEKRLIADVTTLEAMASDRLFARFDDECERLL
ncbi:MAG: hypothetical protein ACLGHL_06740, partial [Actinomycetota bacterium]